MIMKKRRKNYSASEKVAILKRHLVGREEISKICEELKLQPSQFYTWQKQFFENGALAFERKTPSSQATKDQKKIEYLESKLQRKHEVLSELMEEHVRLKKDLGEP